MAPDDVSVGGPNRQAESKRTRVVGHAPLIEGMGHIPQSEIDLFSDAALRDP